MSAVGWSSDVTAPRDTAYTFGGKGSLARIDLTRDVSGSLEGTTRHLNQSLTLALGRER